MHRVARSLLFFAGLMMPVAKADILFVGSQTGLDAFNVDAHQVDSQEVLLTVTLTEGAQYFVNTGSGQHPGFAFNISGDPNISVTNISAPWTLADVQTTSISTGGPSLGTFDYYIDNPGNGASAHNDATLSFDVSVSTGTLSVSNFVANAAGYDFTADIMDASGNTGLSGIMATSTAVPEPASFLLIGTLCIGLAMALKSQRLRGSK
jgi:hypothetical protein